MLSPGQVIADLPRGYARAIAAGGDDWRTTLRPYWLDRLRFLGGEASFAAARRLCHLLAVTASGPAWRSASTYESLDLDRCRCSSPAPSLSKRDSSGITGSTHVLVAMLPRHGGRLVERLS